MGVYGKVSLLNTSLGVFVPLSKSISDKPGDNDLPDV